MVVDGPTTETYVWKICAKDGLDLNLEVGSVYSSLLRPPRRLPCELDRVHTAPALLVLLMLVLVLLVAVDVAADVVVSFVDVGIVAAAIGVACC